MSEKNEKKNDGEHSIAAEMVGHAIGAVASMTALRYYGLPEKLGEHLFAFAELTRKISNTVPLDQLAELSNREKELLVEINTTSREIDDATKMRNDIEKDVTAEVLREAEALQGQRNHYLSNAEKRSMEIKRRLAEDPAWCQLTDKINELRRRKDDLQVELSAVKIDLKAIFAVLQFLGNVTTLIARPT